MQDRNPIRRQRGVALFVALMLVVITTALGLAVMQVGTAETRSIGNEELDRATFHAAEAAALEAYGNLDSGTISTVVPSAVPVTGIDERIDATVTARHEGMLPLMNSSLRLFSRSAYAIESVATFAEGGSRRTVVLGATQIVPRAP